jgi:hypothetical protein
MATPRSFGRPHSLLLGQWLEASFIKIANVSRWQVRKLGKNIFELVEEVMHGWFRHSSALRVEMVDNTWTEDVIVPF